jgi:ATP-dependent Lon protease
MATALASLITGRCVRSDVAMTGEITLTGQVLPIGGLKEKAIAAQQLGTKVIIAPSDNKPDVEEIPKGLLKNVKFEFVESIDEVLKIALNPTRKKASPNGKATKTPSKNSTQRVTANSKPTAKKSGGKKPAKKRVRVASGDGAARTRS